jgi:hypothetical protein
MVARTAVPPGAGIKRRSRAEALPRSQAPTESRGLCPWGLEPHVSEARHVPYVHDQHRPDHGVRYRCWRCAMTGADRVIRWMTAGAVVDVATVAAVASYEHAYALVRARGEAGWTDRLVHLTVDGLIYASSMVMLDSARRRVPVPALARWLLALASRQHSRRTSPTAWAIASPARLWPRGLRSRWSALTSS